MNSKYFLISAIIAVIFLLPFFFIIQYTHLAADDFCRASSNIGDFSKNIRVWYWEQNGRFVNAILSYIPVYDPPVYKTLLGLSAILLGGAIYVFVSKTFNFFNISLSRSRHLLISVLFYVFLVSHIPSLYEFFYWYAGTSAYLYSTIFFLLFIVKLQDLYSHGKGLMPAVLLVILIIGNNEMLLPLTNFLILVVWIKSIQEKKKFNHKMFFVFLAGILSSLVVFLSPGTQIRRTHFPEGGDLLYSIKAAILSSGMFSVKEIFNFHFLILSIGLVLLIAGWSRNKNNFKTFHPLLLAFISFICFSLVVFIPIYSIGFLYIRSGRIGNMIHIIWWILVFYNLLNLSLYLIKKPLLKNKLLYKFPGFLIGIFLFSLFFQNKNYQNLMNDIRMKSFSRFAIEMNQRVKRLKDSPNKVLIIEEIYNPRTFTYFDISSNGEFWENQCYTNAVNKRYQKKYLQIKTREQNNIKTD